MTVLREPEYFEQEMVQRIDQDDKQDSIRALTRHVKDLEAQEVSMSKAIRYMGDDDAGIERLVADLKEATRERKHAQEELEQLRKEQQGQNAMREQLKAVKAMMYGITQAGLNFTYEEKRAFLYMLNICVVVNPAGTEPRYTITAGKHAQVRLPLRDCDSMMPMIYDHATTRRNRRFTSPFTRSYLAGLVRAASLGKGGRHISLPPQARGRAPISSLGGAVVSRHTHTWTRSKGASRDAKADEQRVGAYAGHHFALQATRFYISQQRDLWRAERGL